MNVTDKQVEAALKQLPHGYPTTLQPFVVKQMIEAAMQAAWVKFDINDESTHPLHLQHVIVLYHTGVVGSEKWSSISNTWLYSGCSECVTHWMPLPEYKGN